MERDPGEAHASPPRRGAARIALLFIGLSAALYYPTFLSWFSSDDFLHLGRVIRGGIPFTPDGGSGGFLRPVTGASLWLEYQIWGLWPPGFHAVNVLLHTANALLVSLLAWRLLPDLRAERGFVAVMSGLLFLALGCHAEPVAWISGRTDLLGTLFTLLALVCIERGCDGRRGTTGGTLERPAPGWMAASLVCAILAYFSKESAIVLPLLVVLVALRLGKLTGGVRGFRPLTHGPWIGVGLHVALLAAYFIARRIWIGEFVGGYGAHGHLRAAPDLIAQATAGHVWRTFLPPVGGAAAPVPLSGLSARVWLLLLAAGAAAIIWSARRPGAGRLALFLCLGYAIALLPVFNIRVSWTTPEGERFLYLASVFAAMGLACALAALPGRKLRHTLLALVLFSQALPLHLAVRQWRDASLLARAVVRDIQAQHTGGPLILVNKPDSIRGALVLRTGLPDALRHFGPQPAPELEARALYATDLLAAAHPFDFRSAGATFIIEAGGHTALLAEEDRADDIETLVAAPERVTFRFRDPVAFRRVFVYDAGRVRAIAIEGAPSPEPE